MSEAEAATVALPGAVQKPTVRYRGEATTHPFHPGAAWLFVVDHPQFPADTEVRTSHVLSWDKTGRIETMNTVYVPEVVETKA